MNDEQATRLAEYWAGEATDIDARDIEKTVNSDPLYRELKRAWDSSALPRGGGNAGIFADRLQAKIKNEAVGPDKVQFRRRWMVGIGALATVAIIGVITSKHWRTQTFLQAETVAFKEYATAPGQRATIVLHDGTRVVLNVASRMRVADDYGSKTRAIELIGEAQFTVVHNPDLPFVVRANGTLVRDLATTFVVRAYPGAATTRVAVRDGRVSVQPPAVLPASAVTLDAGTAAIVNADSKALLQFVGRSDAYFGWVKGQLVLTDTPLPEALAELGRWYGLDFRVADDAMLSMHVSGVFPETLNPEGLDAIADIIGARAKHTGSVVVFHPITRTSRVRTSSSLSTH